MTRRTCCTSAALVIGTFTATRLSRTTPAGFYEEMVDNPAGRGRVIRMNTTSRPLRTNEHDLAEAIAALAYPNGRLTGFAAQHKNSQGDILVEAQVEIDTDNRRRLIRYVEVSAERLAELTA